MSLQTIPKTIAESVVKVVRPPVDVLIGAGSRALAAVERQFSGGAKPTDATKETTEQPAVEPTKAKAKSKPKPKPRKAATRAKKPNAANGAKRPPTPASKTPAAERPEVIAEQTDGLDDAVDPAAEVLGERDAPAA